MLAPMLRETAVTKFLQPDSNTLAEKPVG